MTEEQTYILYALHIDSDGERPGGDFQDVGFEEVVRKCRKHEGSYRWKSSGLRSHPPRAPLFFIGGPRNGQGNGRGICRHPVQQGWVLEGNPHFY